MSTETKESQEIIFRRVKKCFHDVPTFDRAIAPALRSVIADAHSVEFGKKTVARAAKRYFYVDELKQKGETTLAAQIELVLEVCYTAILADRTEFEHLQYKNVEQLKQAYAGFEEFSSADRAELELLLAFRNAVKIALVIIPAHRNKARLLKIGGRLEGSKKEYITGSGQSIEVSRRVRIYEQEGGEVAETRPPRQRKSKNSDEASGNPAPKRVRKNAKVTTSLATAPGVMDALVTDSEDSGSEEELEHDFNKYVTPSFPIAQVSTATAASKPKEALPTSKALIGGMGQMTAARSFGDLLLAAQTHIPFARSAQPAPAPEVYIDPLAPYVTPTATALPMAVPVNSSFAAMLANSTVGATIPGSLPLLSSFASVPLSLSASAQGQAEAPMYRECSLGLYTAMDLIIDAAGLERDFQGR